MSKIQWTNKVWNPVTGCNKVSQGCKNCYAEIMHTRLMGIVPDKYSQPFLSGVQVHEDELKKPLHWKNPCMIFVNSMSDLFHKDVDIHFIAKVFAIMFICHQHTFQILTKRADRLPEILNSNEFFELVWRYANQLQDKFVSHLEQELFFYDEIKSAFPLKNVWLGVSVEDQKTADERIPLLLQVPAAVRFLSCEPLLGPVDILHSTLQFLKSATDEKLTMKFFSGAFSNRKGDSKQYIGIDWVIAGGESGHNARPMHPDWVRSIRNECKAANVPFFFKQWGEYIPNGQSHLSSDYGPRLDEPMSYFPDMDDYDIDLDKWEKWRAKNSIKLDDHGLYTLRVGKSKSGNMLDGVQHLNFPQP